MSDVSVVIPTKNAGPLFEEVLAAVLGEAPEAEVLVIDSGSTDGTLEIAAEFPVEVLEIRPESFDHGGTRNLGVERTDGEFVVFLTQDATPLEGWLDALLAPLRADDTIAGAYSRQVPREDATPMKRHFLDTFYPPEPETRSLDPGERPTIDDTFFSNVSSAVRRSVHEWVPFPEDPLTSEDQAWAARVLDRGHRIHYAADSRVRHSHREGIFDVFRRYYDSGASLDFAALAPSRSGSVRRMAGYQVDELRYLAGNGHARWIPYALAYAGAKAAGMALGRVGHRLPLAVRRRASDTLSTKHR